MPRENNNLTEEQKAKYLEKKGVRCPYCFSDNICSGEIDADGATATAIVECNNCYQEWMDTWTLTGVDTYASPS